MDLYKHVAIESDEKETLEYKRHVERMCELAFSAGQRHQTNLILQYLLQQRSDIALIVFDELFALLDEPVPENLKIKVN